MDIEKFKELLKLRREAKGEEEKAIIDKAIDRLIDERPCYHSSPGEIFPKPPYQITC